jgi:hypothetical protein
MKTILMVLTSHAKLGDTGKATGFWLEEDMLTAKGGTFSRAAGLAALRRQRRSADHRPESSFLRSGGKGAAETAGIGRRRCYDNILLERLWRTVKYVAASFSAKPSRGLPTCLQ